MLQKIISVLRSLLTDGSTLTSIPNQFGVWTDKYKEFLESVTVDSKNPKKKQFIEKFIDNSTESNVDIDVKMHYRTLLNLRKTNKNNDINNIEDKLHLTKKISLTNVHTYDANHHVKKYSSVNDIMKEFYTLRIGKYAERKEYWLKVYKKELERIDFKMKFIMEIINDTIDLRKKKKTEIDEMLESKGYPKLAHGNSTEKSYDYLVKMPLSTLSLEMVEKLRNQLEEKKQKYKELFEITPSKIWLNELRELFNEYTKMEKSKN